MDKENQTRYSFSEKWRGSSGFQLGGVDAFDSDTLNWICTRNGFTNIEEFGQYLGQFQTVLDAGCGNGRVLGLFAEIAPNAKRYGCDFSSADVARGNLGTKIDKIFDADLLDQSELEQIPKPDFIYCQEVLHHTQDPARSFSNLVSILQSNGEIAIYVYKQKAPVREYVDDFVRSLIAAKPHNEALELMRDFTELGRVLSELDVEVEVPDVRLLEIPAGRYQVQRLLYNFFVKCYWNPELTIEDNNMINYDWYHPSLCSRHTLGEVLEWFASNKVEVVHSYVDEYGITVRGKKV